jgi:hypothetical protein
VSPVVLWTFRLRVLVAPKYSLFFFLLGEDVFFLYNFLFARKNGVGFF